MAEDIVFALEVRDLLEGNRLHPIEVGTLITIVFKPTNTCQRDF